MLLGCVFPLLFLGDGHSDCSEVESHWWFYLYFPKGEGWWTLFKHLLAIHISSFESCLVSSLPHLLIGCFLTFNICGVLYTLILIPYVLCSWQKGFSCSISCLFTLGSVSFTGQKMLNCMSSLMPAPWIISCSESPYWCLDLNVFSLYCLAISDCWACIKVFDPFWIDLCVCAEWEIFILPVSLAPGCCFSNIWFFSPFSKSRFLWLGGFKRGFCVLSIPLSALYQNRVIFVTLVLQYNLRSGIVRVAIALGTSVICASLNILGSFFFFLSGLWRNIWDFSGDYAGSIAGFLWHSHLHNINPFHLWTCEVFPISNVVFSFFLQCFKFLL